MNWTDRPFAWNIFMRNLLIDVRSVVGISLDQQWYVHVCGARGGGGGGGGKGEGEEDGCERGDKVMIVQSKKYQRCVQVPKAA